MIKKAKITRALHAKIDRALDEQPCLTKIRVRHYGRTYALAPCEHEAWTDNCLCCAPLWGIIVYEVAS